MSLAVSIAYFVGRYISYWHDLVLEEMGGLWSGISAALVLRNDHLETLSAGFSRVVGTLIGWISGG